MLSGIQWRNANKSKSYPFYENSDIPNNYFLDVIFFLDSPVILKSITNTQDFIEINFSSNNRGVLYWRINKNAPQTYLFNDYGKIVYGEALLAEMSALPVFTTKSYNSRVLDTLCYDERNLSLQGLVGDIVIEKGDSSNVTTVDRNITIELDEQLGFAFTGISRVNNIDIVSQHLIIGGDNCTDILPYKVNSIAINDKCLPPCYDCNERLTEGDMDQLMTELEDRVTELEE